MPKAGVLLALATGALMALFGGSPWLALGVVAVWLGSLWLSRPEPEFERQRDRSFTVSRETIAPFIEPLGVPLLLLDGERIVAANKAAREALGSHVTGQDARIALRHPEAIELLSNETLSEATIRGLTTPRSIWQLSRFRIDDRFRLIEFVNRTAEADISRAHTDFVANASHELRTPLASIIGYVETLADAGAGLPDQDRARFLDTIAREANRMQTLIADLMSLSRIEAEKHDLPEDEVDLAALAATVVGDIGTLVGADRISFTSEADRQIVRGDRGQIEQLIRNLADNALKYSDDAVPVQVKLDGRSGASILTISDTGPGIPAEHLPHITRRFYRTDPGRSRAAGGTGLGLAIVKHIVERHRAQLDIESVEGEGTRVSIAFPPQAPALS